MTRTVSRPSERDDAARFRARRVESKIPVEYFGGRVFSVSRSRCWTNNGKFELRRGRSFGRKKVDGQETAQEEGMFRWRRPLENQTVRHRPSLPFPTRAAPPPPSYPGVRSIGALLDFTKKHCSRFGIIRSNSITGRPDSASKIAKCTIAGR